MDDDLPLWTINDSTYVVNDRFMKVRRDACTTPRGGKVGKYYVLEYDDWVNCVALDADSNVITLRHYRHGARKYLMEFVGGGVEPNDASPEIAARRELAEEAGYTGGTFYHVGTSYPNPASHTNKVHTFLALGGVISQKQNLEIGESIVVERLPFETVIQRMSAPGAAYSAIHVAAWFHVLNFIRSSTDPALAHFKKHL